MRRNTSPAFPDLKQFRIYLNRATGSAFINFFIEILTIESIIKSRIQILLALLSAREPKYQILEVNGNTDVVF